MGDLTKTPGNASGKIQEEEFNYIQNNITLMEERQKEDGGGIEVGSRWNRYRRIYRQEDEPGNSVLGKKHSGSYRNPKIGYAAITIDRQIPKLRFDNPEVRAVAQNPEFESQEDMVSNAMTHEIRHYIKLEDKMDDINTNALVTPYSPVFIGWNDNEDMDQSFMQVMEPEDFLYDPHSRGGDIDTMKMCAQRVNMSKSELMNLEKLYPGRFYNTAEVKPNIFPENQGLADGTDPWANDPRKAPKGYKYHHDTVQVYFYYDGANKRVTAVPAGARFEIGRWDFPKKGITGYPFEILQYNRLPWQFCGISDMDRYAEIAEQLQLLEGFILAAIKSCVPKFIYDQNKFQGKKLDRLTDSSLWGAVGIDPQGEPIGNAFHALVHPGIHPTVLQGAERLRRELSGASTTFESERTGQSEGIPTATQAQMVQMYTDIKTAYRLRIRDRFLARCMQKVHALMVLNVTKPRNYPWVMQDSPASYEQGKPKKWSGPFSGKDMAGDFKFKLDLVSGEDGNRIVERKLFADFMGIIGKWPLSPDSMAYVLRTASKLFGMDPNKISIQQAPPQAQGGEVPPSPFNDQGGAAQVGAALIPQQMMEGM